jgi:hypothetical protein
MYDLIVIGSGTAGIMAALKASSNNKKVLLLEQQSKLAPKLKATGGGKCNLTNTLSKDEFISHFGKNGRFITPALDNFSNTNLMEFFKSIGVKTHFPDGFRVFPITHNSQTIIDALEKALEVNKVEIKYNSCVLDIEKIEDEFLIKLENINLKSKNILIATGGLGYKSLGASGDGHRFASNFGHHITKTYPAMMPLNTLENWTKNCTADTIAKVKINVDIKKHKKLTALGDLIFTKNGIRGPVVLDFAREITPLFDKYDSIPISINMIKNKTQDDLIKMFKEFSQNTILEVLEKILPKSVIIELTKIIEVDYNLTFKKLQGEKKELLLKIFCSTPLTIVGHDGFKLAMITRGGIDLKEIDSKTMQSKKIAGLYFAGEIVDIDGPCGGYNLQWAFSSGYLSGELLK